MKALLKRVACMTVEPEIAAFAQCWNEGKFFMAHEVLEGLWVRRRDDGLQGLIQLAVALYHIERGNLRGAKATIERARRRLANRSSVELPFSLAVMGDYAAYVARALESGATGKTISQRPRL